MPPKPATPSFRELRSIIKWLGVLAFFAVMPVAFLNFADFALFKFMGGGDSSAAKDFRLDLPLIVLAFWGGTMGTIVAYVYQRLQGDLQKQRLIYPIARFLFGGIVGAASYYVLRSGFLIKLLYPKLETAALEANKLVDYRSVVAVAVISGLLAPTIVRALQNKAADTEQMK